MLLIFRNLSCVVLASVAAAPIAAVTAEAQDFVSHRAAYVVTSLDRGRGGGDGGPIGSYAFEIRANCDGGYTVHQRMKLEFQNGRNSLVSEQQSSMTESSDGKRFSFEHRGTANGKATSQFKGDATFDGGGGAGQARFSEPAGQTVALPAETLFPVAIARATVRRALAGENGFEAAFFFGDKVKPPQAVNVLIGKVPRRLADLPTPDGAGALVAGQERIYFRGGFFDVSDGKVAGDPAYEMSSVTLANGIELYGTNEQADVAIEYKLTRLESLSKAECK
jgi:hypothetical protein